MARKNRSLQPALPENPPALHIAASDNPPPAAEPLPAPVTEPSAPAPSVPDLIRELGQAPDRVPVQVLRKDGSWVVGCRLGMSNRWLFLIPRENKVAGPLAAKALGYVGWRPIGDSGTHRRRP